jgi:carbon storage regulator CsrA
MLILTRKRNDSIRIGENIVVRVMRTAPGSVKIGIEAPESVRVVRGELNDVGDVVNLEHEHEQELEREHESVEPTHDVDDCDANVLLLQH